MFGGLPVEIITAFVSMFASGVMTMWSQSNTDKQERRMWRMDSYKLEMTDRDRADLKTSPAQMSMKKFLAVSAMLIVAYIVIAPALFNVPTQVPVEVTTGFKILFLDFTNTITEYVKLEGTVVPEYLGHIIALLFGSYFGHSISKRR